MYASILDENDKLNEARSAYNEALKLKKRKEAYLNLAIVEQNLGLLDDALKSLTTAKEAQSNLLNEKIIDAKISYNFASIFLDKYQNNKNDIYLKKAEEYLNKSIYLVNVNSNLQASFYNAKAMLYEFQKKYQESANYYLKSINLKTNILFKNNEFLKLGITYNNISTLLLKVHDYRGAKENAYEAIKIFNNMSNNIYATYAYFNLAEAEEKLGKLKNSLFNYQHAKDSYLSSLFQNKIIENKINDKINLLTCFNRYGKKSKKCTK
jgi:tetratricopeptide (TPR) repeat protein